MVVNDLDVGIYFIDLTFIPPSKGAPIKTIAKNSQNLFVWFPYSADWTIPGIPTKFIIPIIEPRFIVVEPNEPRSVDCRIKNDKDKVSITHRGVTIEVQSLEELNGRAVLNFRYPSNDL